MDSFCWLCWSIRALSLSQVIRPQGRDTPAVATAKTASLGPQCRILQAGVGHCPPMGRGAPPPALTTWIYYHKSYEQIKEKSTLTIEEMESFGQGRYMHMRTSAAHLQFTHQYHLSEKRCWVWAVGGGIGYERRRAELEGNREAREAAALQVLNTQVSSETDESERTKRFGVGYLY
ncbi:hypothetical protein SRHO_G00301310 [Serrasalmus rhombeus]